MTHNITIEPLRMTPWQVQIALLPFRYKTADELKDERAASAKLSRNEAIRIGKEKQRAKTEARVIAWMHRNPDMILSQITTGTGLHKSSVISVLNSLQKTGRAKFHIGADKLKRWNAT